MVITGASTGIGEQLAYEYAKLGANVFITARREKLLKQVKISEVPHHSLFLINQMRKR